YPYTFKVVNQKEINAFALPGGPIYVNLGTIQAAHSEAELAGVMGHEIAHVVMRHATNAASKQVMAQAPLAILGGMLGRGAGAQLAQLGISFGLGSLFLKYSRDAETQADLVGAGILHDSGYNPQAMVSFFETLSAEGAGGRGAEFFQSHPNPENRAQKVAAEVRTLPARSYSADSAEFREVKKLVAGMKPPSAKEIAARQEATAGQVERSSAAEIMPSGNYRSWSHSAYRISHPDNWEVFGDTRSAVTIAPRAGVSENAVAYGVMLNGYDPESNRVSLDAATHQLLQSLLRSNPEHRAVGHDENIRVNGVPGKSIELIGPSPIRDKDGRAERERNWLVTLQRRDGSLLYAVFICPERNYAELRPAFERMLRSLRLN
ncbi:MAG: M48 family metalloprotease, partial [Terriglobales bacterium]